MFYTVADIFVSSQSHAQPGYRKDKLYNATFSQVVLFYSKGVGIPAVQATVIPPTIQPVLEHRIFFS